MRIRTSRYERVTGTGRRARIGTQREKHARAETLSETLKSQCGERIRVAREALGLSQTEFGAETGVLLPQAVSKYEKGEHFPPFVWLVAMNERFGITPNYVILGWAEDIQRSELRKAVKTALRNRNTI